MKKCLSNQIDSLNILSINADKAADDRRLGQRLFIC